MRVIFDFEQIVYQNAIITVYIGLVS